MRGVLSLEVDLDTEAIEEAASINSIIERRIEQQQNG
jgi:hypothetical protein